MAGAVLLRAGRHLRWVGERGPIGPEIPLVPEGNEVGPGELPLPEDLRARLLAARPPGPLTVSDPGLRRLAPRPMELAELPQRRGARALGWPAPTPADRAFYLTLAHRMLDARLEDPVEILISLTREEERVERSQRKEASAAQHFLAPEKGVLEGYRRSWEEFRRDLDRHHDRLEEEMVQQARAVAPNLSRLVGPKVAARLIAQAGGQGALARMSGSKLQLLGSRRRPGPGKTPRFGVLFRADGVDRVPASRQGAFARSLASLAAVAARLDTVRPEERCEKLLGRRDRRIRELSRSGR